MGKRIEMDLEEKEYLIQECLAGRMRMREAARRAGVGHSTMHNWVSRYRAEGASALSENGNAQKRTYSEELRQKVVEEYLSGQGSSMAIAEKYKLRSGNLVLDWAKEYHRHREHPKETGGVSMARRNHTLEERVQAVREYLEEGKDFSELSEKYRTTAQVVRSWVKRYQEMGVAGLEDRRGKRLASQTPRTAEEALRIEKSRLERENYLLRMELDLLKKVQELERGGSLRQFRQERQYEAVRWAAEEQGYPVAEACRALHISRAGYYQWRSGKAGARTVENRRLAGLVKQIHDESPDKGYRRIRDDLARYYAMPVNDKRALRICRSLGIQSTIKYARHGCTRSTSAPQYLAENVLNRQFCAEKPNEKWLTDVTEFKYYVGPTVHKLYLSAILDLCDRRIVSFVLRDANDSALVYETLDQALAANPDAHPLFHSDRGFQYTTRVFHDKLAAAGMTQSMSRVGKCIDNGPMEGFWGILKRERYYGRRFTSREQLCGMIREYIAYYNFSRLQRRLGVHTPMEVYTQCRAA